MNTLLKESEPRVFQGYNTAREFLEAQEISIDEIKRRVKDREKRNENELKLDEHSPVTDEVVYFLIRVAWAGTMLFRFKDLVKNTDSAPQDLPIYGAWSEYEEFWEWACEILQKDPDKFFNGPEDIPNLFTAQMITGLEGIASQAGQEQNASEEYPMLVVSELLMISFVKAEVDFLIHYGQHLPGSADQFSEAREEFLTLVDGAMLD